MSQDSDAYFSDLINLATNLTQEGVSKEDQIKIEELLDRATPEDRAHYVTLLKSSPRHAKRFLSVYSGRAATKESQKRKRDEDMEEVELVQPQRKSLRTSGSSSEADDQTLKLQEELNQIKSENAKLKQKSEEEINRIKSENAKLKQKSEEEVRKRRSQKKKLKAAAKQELITNMAPKLIVKSIGKIEEILRRGESEGMNWTKTALEKQFALIADTDAGLRRTYATTWSTLPIKDQLKQFHLVFTNLMSKLEVKGLDRLKAMYNRFANPEANVFQYGHCALLMYQKASAKLASLEIAIPSSSKVLQVMDEFSPTKSVTSPQSDGT